MSKAAFFWAILTAIVWGMVPILEKIGLAKIHPDTGLFLRCFGVVFGAVILLILKFDTLKLELSTISPRALIFLISAGILASFVAQLFFYRALKFGVTSKVVAISSMYPLVAFILALIFLGEKLTLIKFLGLCFVLLGVVLLR